MFSFAFTSAVKLIESFSVLWYICFVDLNPSIRGFGAQTELSNSFGSSLITQASNKNSTQLTRAVGFRETSRKHHENHRFTQLQPHLASSIFAAVECKPSVGPNCITTDSSKRSCSSVMVEAVEVEANQVEKNNNMFMWNWAYLLNFYGWCSQQLKLLVI